MLLSTKRPPGAVQLSFTLPAKPRTVVDDPTGSIVYTPDFVRSERAAAWYAALRDGIDWDASTRPMYDRVVEVPRLTAHFGPADTLPAALAQARHAVEAHLAQRFDAFGLNWYRDGDDSVAPHHDQTGELDPGALIALLSLGATRLMRIASLALPRRSFAVALEAGSLLVMSAAVQAHWTHAVPKVRAPVGPRISIALRRRRTLPSGAPRKAADGEDGTDV
ncbi:MAG: alpha-ketoglutarate-dependent dioxygenase AlkB [Candidatus Baltobacteraceae bacterium]